MRETKAIVAIVALAALVGLSSAANAQGVKFLGVGSSDMFTVSAVATFNDVPKVKTPQVRLTELSDRGVPIEVRERIAASLPSQAKRVGASSAQMDVMAAENARAFEWIKQQLKSTDAPPMKSEPKPATHEMAR